MKNIFISNGVPSMPPMADPFSEQCDVEKGIPFSKRKPARKHAASRFGESFGKIHLTDLEKAFNTFSTTHGGWFLAWRASATSG